MATSSAENIVTNVASKLFNITLKAEQTLILNALLDGKDCMAVLPTGFGKSIPYQMLVSTKREMGTYDGKKVLVCSPLVALMKDQCDRMSKMPDVKAIYKGGSSSCTLEEVRVGDFQYLFASPETLVGDADWRRQLQELEFSTIVVDEFHTIATWGEDKENGQKAFREWFSHLGELRSLFPDASVLALSATCTQKIRSRVKRVLNLKSDLVDVSISPNQENIKLVVNKMANTVEMAMAWIIDALQDGNFPKTLIYCMSVKDASNIYMYILSEIPDCSSVNMFHSETDEVTKSKILEGLKDANSQLKIVVATSALGMGIDIVNFYNVVLYGCPSIVDIVQEIGRVGRDGKSATALLLYNSFHLRKKEMDVKDVYLKSSPGDCRRLNLLKPFLTEKGLSEVPKGGHSCCDLCYDSCNCGNCAKTEIETIFHYITVESDSESSDSDTQSYDVLDFADTIDLSLLLDNVDFDPDFDF